MSDERPSGDSALLLKAKYHQHEADRKLAGDELIRQCVCKSDYGTLLLVVRDLDFAHELRQDAASALVQIVCALCERAPPEPAISIICDKAIPYESREKMGDAFARACVQAGAYPHLVSLVKSPSCPTSVSEYSKQALPEMVLNAGAFDTIEALAADKDLPSHTRQLFGMKLFEICSLDEDIPGLLCLAANKDAHEEPRKAAAFKVFHFYEEAGSFSGMQSMVEDASLLYDARKSMALRIIDLCIESGNYPLLITMSASPGVPLNIRLDMEERIDLAASKAVENAISIGDRSLLSFMSRDERLNEIIRRRSAAALEKLDRAATQNGSAGRTSRPPPIREELASKLAEKLGRTSQPPPSTRKN